MLLPLKKILCTTDFSDCSYEALKTASELASHFEAELCLVHILPEIPRPNWAGRLSEELEMYEPGLSEFEDALHTCAQQKLHEVIKKHLPGEVKSRAIVGAGDPANEIVRIADGEHAGLIVISTHGMTGWRQIAFGSVAERVLRLSNRPVLSVRSCIRL